MIAIDKKIPVPAVTRGPRATAYPFKRMTVGDSFTMPRENALKAKVAAHRYKTANPGWNYQSAIDADIIRIWRIA